VTTKTWANRSIFQVAESAEVVVEVLLRHRAAHAYLLHEFVVMPDHLHLLLTPGRATTLEKAMQLIKGGSSYEIHKRRGNRAEIWQPGFHEQTIRDAQEFFAKARYIRMNPVEARLVNTPEQWPHGSVGAGMPLDNAPSLLASGAKARASLQPVVGAKAPTP
jgi:REP-associated tyrosine transposase